MCTHVKHLKEPSSLEHKSLNRLILLNDHSSNEEKKSYSSEVDVLCVCVIHSSSRRFIVSVMVEQGIIRPYWELLSFFNRSRVLRHFLHVLLSPREDFLDRMLTPGNKSIPLLFKRFLRIQIHNEVNFSHTVYSPLRCQLLNTVLQFMASYTKVSYFLWIEEVRLLLPRELFL
jgi:hypothetical protein